MELCEGKPLSRFLEDRVTSLDEKNNELGYKDLQGDDIGIDREENYDIFYCLVSGLKEFHKCKIAHNDIRPSNIVTKTNSCPHNTYKIADLGSAQIFKNEASGSSDEEVEQKEQTELYKAPEKNKEQSMSQDIFQCGLVLYELCIKMKPKQKKANKNLMVKA